MLITHHAEQRSLLLRYHKFSPQWTELIRRQRNQQEALENSITQQGRRVKPDLVAPGTGILSNHSSVASQPQPAFRFALASNDYEFMNGTSMATPLIAGAVACIRQYMRRVLHPLELAPTAFIPGALVKAALINTCIYYPQLNAEWRHPQSSWPRDSEQGWGRPHLARLAASCFAIGRAWKAADVTQTREFEFSLSQQDRLDITLAYYDAPGPRIQNDLRFYVIVPATAKPVACCQGRCILTPDTVHCFRRLDALPGTYKVVVSANLDKDQPYFGLVWSATSLTTKGSHLRAPLQHELDQLANELFSPGNTGTAEQLDRVRNLLNNN